MVNNFVCKIRIRNFFLGHTETYSHHNFFNESREQFFKLPSKWHFENWMIQQSFPKPLWNIFRTGKTYIEPFDL